MPPLVSICLTCKDRWELTRQALDSIVSTVPRNMYRLFIVDDDSANENQKELANWHYGFEDRTGIMARLVFAETTNGVGSSKNFAAYVAAEIDMRDSIKSDYLCLLDNDVVCRPCWLETLIDSYEAAKDIGYRLLGGYAHPYNQTNRIHYLNVGGGGDLKVCDVHEKNAVDGLCHFMEWETWDRFGPYDSHAQGVRQSEDFAFCRKIVDAGFKVGVVYPHVIENHGVVDTFGEKIPGWELVQKELSSVGPR